jgi:hypothetical protein
VTCYGLKHLVAGSPLIERLNLKGCDVKNRGLNLRFFFRQRNFCVYFLFKGIEMALSVLPRLTHFDITLVSSLAGFYFFILFFFVQIFKKKKQIRFVCCWGYKEIRGQTESVEIAR